LKVLIVGSSGYIGTKLSRYLVENQIQTSGVDLLPSKVDGIEHLQMDFLHLEENFLKNFTHIVLLAASSSVRACEDNRVESLTNNIVSLEALLCKIYGNQTLIFASSGSVYDGVNSLEATEDFTLATPRNLYDLTKRMGEELIKLSSKRSVVLRFGTVSGPSDNIRGDLVINKMVKDARESRFVTVSNKHVNRAFLSIDDLCNWIQRIIMTDSSGPKMNIVNLSSFNSTMGNLGQSVAAYFEVPIIEGQDGSTYNFSMNSEKAERIFAYKAQDTLYDVIGKLDEYYSSLMN